LHDASVAPDRVLKLLLAESEEKATEAYWSLDGLVCANGITHPAALAVTQFILSALPSRTTLVCSLCLELLGQTAAGESFGIRDVVAYCRTELLQIAWYFLHGLQHDDVQHVWLYVDAVPACGFLSEFSRARDCIPTARPHPNPGQDGSIVDRQRARAV
jgi:hypothetical protein